MRKCERLLVAWFPPRVATRPKRIKPYGRIRRGVRPCCRIDALADFLLRARTLCEGIAVAHGVHAEASAVLATDPATRGGLFDSIGEGRFGDEADIVARPARPLAIPHGAAEQFVGLEYLNKLAIQNLWRGAVQVLAGTGHAPHEEAPQEFTALLSRFVTDVG